MDLQIMGKQAGRRKEPMTGEVKREIGGGEVVKVGFPLGLETKRVEGQRLISPPPHPFPAGGIGGGSSTTRIRRHPPHTAFCLPSPTIDYTMTVWILTVHILTVYQMKALSRTLQVYSRLKLFVTYIWQRAQRYDILRSSQLTVLRFLMSLNFLLFLIFISPNV
jgi:hypothetical protein